MLDHSGKRRVIRLLVVGLLFSTLSVPGVSVLHAEQAAEIESVRGWWAPSFWQPRAVGGRQDPGTSPGARSAEQAASVPTTPLSFVAIAPCRMADTRVGSPFTGPYGPPAIGNLSSRDFIVTGRCGIPANAVAVSFNFAVTSLTANGNLTVFPAGGVQAEVSSLNWTPSEVAISNAAVIALGTGGAITVLHNGVGSSTVDVIIDVNGYYGGSIVNSLNALTGDVTLAPGNNVQLGIVGNVITIGSTTGLVLPFAGTNPFPDGGVPGFKITSAGGTAVVGVNGLGVGVLGTSQQSAGVRGTSTEYAGVRGEGGGGSAGVIGYGSVGCCLGTGFGAGVYGEGTGSPGVVGYSKSAASVRGYKANGDTGDAGSFDGNVTISGTLTKSAGSFRIDHPLDPANRYLYHSFVESPDMKNIYDGIVEVDERGEAVVTLPDWFEALNERFRYQLTCVGSYAPVYVAREIANGRFVIAGGKPGMKVSWQVTGIRHDPYAVAHRIPVEETKPANERGTFLYRGERGDSIPRRP